MALGPKKLKKSAEKPMTGPKSSRVGHGYYAQVTKKKLEEMKMPMKKSKKKAGY